MPELPEVETIRRDLHQVLPGKKISQVEVHKPKIIRGSAATFRKKLAGERITKINRRGKLLIIELRGKKRPSYAKATEGKWILIHLKMTGQLIYQDKKKFVVGGHPEPLIEMPGKYTHVEISFTGGGQLFFNDMRQFGYMRLVNEKQLSEVMATYGVEPLTADFTVDALAIALGKRQTALKNALLDQTKIAGLGNIYVDEACFVARVRPMRRVNKVSKNDLRNLHLAINKIIKAAVKERGTTFSAYRDGRGVKGGYVRLLKVYGRAGQKCKRCRQADIKKTKIGGRGTTYCPVCQPR